MLQSLNRAFTYYDEIKDATGFDSFVLQSLNRAFTYYDASQQANTRLIASVAIPQSGFHLL